MRAKLRRLISRLRSLIRSPRGRHIIDGPDAPENAQALAQQLQSMREPKFHPQAARPVIYLGQNRILTRTIFGQNIILDSRDKDVCPHLALDGFWEPWTTKVMTDTIRQGMTVIDIGAHVGYYTLLACSRVGAKGKVISFEPDPIVFDALLTGVQINGFSDRCECVNQAVSSRPGKQKFYRYETHSGGNTLWGQETRPYDHVEIMDVETVSIDAFFESHGMAAQRVDVVKIDAEGSEGLILEGMKKTLVENQGIVIVCEFCPDRMASANMNPESVLDNIIVKGFKLRLIDFDSRLTPVTRSDLLALGGKDVMLYLART